MRRGANYTTQSGEGHCFSCCGIGAWVLHQAGRTEQGKKKRHYYRDKQKYKAQ